MLFVQCSKRWQYESVHGRKLRNEDDD